MSVSASPFRFPEVRICVFAKAPVPGRVKTRLARRLGFRAAARVYRGLLRSRLAELWNARIAPVELWVTPHRHPYLTRLAIRYEAAVRVQATGDLGRRMQRALAVGGPAVIVGGDTPGLPVTRIAQALEVLGTGRDVVVSPAEDGGYTLIGARRPVTAPFRGVSWGTSRVMSETRRRLRRAGLSAEALPTSWDLDDWRDWRRWRRVRT